MVEKVKVFAGNSNVCLAEKIANSLNLTLGKMEIKKFKDGEIFLRLKENIKNTYCFIVQSICFPANDNLMEMLIMADSLKRAGAKKIIAVIPYFGYARQDRRARENDPITAKLVADLITAAGIREVLTVDLHVPQIEGFFNIPVTEIKGQNILAKYVKDNFVKNFKDFCVVAPDLGAVKRAKKFSCELGDLPLIVVNKFRKKVNECEVTEVIGEVKGKNLIILDDMIDTANTIVRVAASLKERGAKSIFACATHGVFSGDALEKIEKSEIDSSLILDTIPVYKEITEKLKVISVYEAISEKIKEIVS